MGEQNKGSVEQEFSVGAIAMGVFVSISVVAIWLISWYLIDKHVTSSDTGIATNEAARGVFGDKFGAVNSLFSGLAFTGIIWTLVLQRQDLKRQQREIARQNATLRSQQFENSVFQLLGLHTSIVEKLIIKSHIGRDAFTYFIELLKVSSPEFRIFHALRKLTRQENYELHRNKSIPNDALPRIDSDEKSAIENDIAKGLIIVKKFEESDESYHASLINSSYSLAHEKSKDGLSHYFRNLYHIFKFIDEADIRADDKIRYARIVRAQLSDEELVAIFYNCIAITDSARGLELGYPKMTYFAQKYEILKNLNRYSLIHERHMDIYKSRAKTCIDDMKKAANENP